jgi:hypothetical protein
MLITGHYEFEILIPPLNKNKSDEKTIYRRYSDIEWLHEGLLKFNPGCRIMNLPEKSFWANLNFNNTQLIEKRKNQIEDYLNYIYKHNYLSLNPNFQIFISEDFEKIKNENIKTISTYEKFVNISNIIPSVFKSQKVKGLSAIEDNSKIEKERENLIRLLKAINDLYLNMEEYIKYNEVKTDAIKNLQFAAKNAKYFTLEYKEMQCVFEEDDEMEDVKKNENKSIIKNLAIINEFYEKNKLYCNLIHSNILDQLEVIYFIL